MRLRVRHVTTYRYEKPVTIGQSEARLRPRPTDRQRVRHARVVITPSPDHRNDNIDYFGNLCDVFTLHTPHRELQVLATSEVEVSAAPAVLASASPPWEEARERVVLTGNPVRETIQAIGRKPSAVADETGPLRLLVTGGAPGAANPIIPSLALLA